MRKTLPLHRHLNLSLLAAAALSACTLAPEYTRPDAPVAAAYPEASAEASGSRAHDLAWRDFFADPGLQSLIETALQNNRDLRTAALRIEEARALYNIQSADLLPTVNAGFSGTRTRTPASLSPNGQDTISTSYQVGLSVTSFELDYLGRVRSLKDAALSLYLASEEAQQAAQISLIAEVAKAALVERAFAEQLELARQTLSAREQAYKLAQQRLEVGASSALDLRLSETLVLSARVAVATLARQHAQARNGLLQLIGQGGGTLPTVQPLADQKMAQAIAVGLPSDLLTQRPDIRAAEQRLKAANANIGAARAAFFPRIALTGGFGTASNELSGLFQSGSDTWTFTPQVVLPIFDGGRTSSNRDLAEVRKNIAVAEYEKTVQGAFREVADALVARATFDQQEQAQDAVAQAQAERLRLADLRFAQGIASGLDVLDAQRERFSAEQLLVQTRLQRLLNSIDLYRALGGGVR